MKILYVVSRPLEVNTSSSIRNRATINGLLSLGHSVNLITAEFDRGQINYDEVSADDRLNVKYLKLGGIQKYASVGRKHSFFKLARNSAAAIVSRLCIYDNLKSIADYSLKLNITDSMYDLVISSSDPKSSHLFISKMYEAGGLIKTPWIQIWGDPFLTDISKNNGLMNLLIKKEERRLLKYADKIVYVSGLTLNEQKKLYPQYAEKMTYEPIPYIREEIYPKANKPNDKLTFLYCGDYISNVRNISPLYNTIKASNHRLIICGTSNMKLEAADNIEVYPRTGYAKIKEFEAKADVLIHLSNLKGSQIPGKIYQYSGTNKLILFILDGKEKAVLSIFRKYKRFIFCKNNINDISAAILQIQNGIYDHTRFVVKAFEPEKIAERIVKIQGR